MGGERRTFCARQKAPFKYMYIGTEEVKAGPDGATPATPISGLYQGAFELEGKPIEESMVQIKFSKDGDGFSMSGTGQNTFGSFSLNGRYDPSNRRLAAMKAYVGGGAVDDDDDIDDEDEDYDKAGELAALQAEASMSVEELRAKYNRGGDDGGEPSAKRVKTH